MSELALSHSNIDVACGVSFMSALAISHSNTDVTCGVLSMSVLAISHEARTVVCGWGVSLMSAACTGPKET